MLRRPYDHRPVGFDPAVRRESRARVTGHAQVQCRTVSVTSEQEAAEQEAGGERLGEAIVRERHAARGNAYGPADALGTVPGSRSGAC